MKKLLTALVLTTLSLAAPATTLTAEYDYNYIATTPDGYRDNQYGYFGIAQPLGHEGKFGVVDAGIQGSRTNQTAFSDNQTGWELGYTYPLSFGSISVLPRAAYGAMNKINPDGTGFKLNARYYLLSVEADKTLSDRFGAYVSYSHMGHANDDSIRRANRVQFGIDTALTKSFGLRTGLSFQKFDTTQQNGLVLIGTYTF